MTIETDFGRVARELNLPLENVQNTVALLDEENTVPFITRYRKERTGALNEEQIRQIQDKVGKLRGLAERKQTVLKSLQSQEVLTSELEHQIRQATSPKRLEDLYLPYKPKKQTLATVARKRGLEPLANEILGAVPGLEDLRQRAEQWVDPEKSLPTVDDVLEGARHIIAEWFSEQADVRGRLRKILKQSGRLSCTRLEPPSSPAPSGERAASGEAAANAEPNAEAGNPADPSAPGAAPNALSSAHSPSQSSGLTDESEHAAVTSSAGEGQVAPSESTAVSDSSGETAASDGNNSASPAGRSASADRRDDAQAPISAPRGNMEETTIPAVATEHRAAGDAEQTDSPPVSAAAASESERSPEEDRDAADHATATKMSAAEPKEAEQPKPEEGDSCVDSATAASGATGAGDASKEAPAAQPTVSQGPRKGGAKGKSASKSGPLSASMAKKAKKRKRLEAAFKDYFGFQESVSRIPSHRVLAINRGERTRILRVKMEADIESMAAEAESRVIPEGHPHTEFLKGCVRDAIHRLLFPSLERELRREMTEKAEEHAVTVFARNLRKLFLQPPVSHHRVLAIDPGFRSGCKLVALDEFGNVLGHDIIHVIGKEEWIRKGRDKMVNLIRNHALSVVAIGNGAACRETEQLVVDVMDNELKDQDVAFVIVNEAGASVYSTSQLGREELPGYDAVLRSSISIGRRLLDPLSELVKINPANIGVGMYQHDVKAKHLRKSLDAVVESCVNYVGVDLNTASSSLLRYVSGLNQLTARRLCEYRASRGPFRNRQQLKQVPGFGEAAFVQAAGFLKIPNGDSPLDATWIHPESYGLAEQVLEAAGSRAEDLRTAEGAANPLPASGEFGRLDPEMGPAVGAGRQLTLPTMEVDSPKPPEHPEPSEQQRSEGDPRSQTPVANSPSEPEAEMSLGSHADVSTPSQGAEHRLRVLSEKVRQLDVKKLAQEWSVSEIVLWDIIDSLARPGRDPREDLPAPVFRRGIVKLEDLAPGMRLSGTVLNVVDFGAFVDIGLSDSGLVHISRLADRYVRDPHEVVGVGDVLTVWVVEVDKKRRRVSLTAIEPGTEKSRESRQPSEKRQKRKTSGKRPSAKKTARDSQKQGKDQTSRGKGRKNRASRKPKPVTPITKDMEQGKEPLRSFSDLMQFYEKKQDNEKK